MAFDHLVTLPVVVPLLTGAGLLLLGERRHTAKALVSIGSTAVLVAVSIALLRTVTADPAPDVVVYRIGDWAVPFGIVLVLDRLSALMMGLTACLALATVTFAAARWHRAGPHFHSIFQFLLVGLNGAFLTGDLFNLFVCLEVLLAASYGLVLHGSGETRVRAGLHYLVINLTGAMLLLVGISLIYGVTGTLNMADLATRMALLTGEERALARAAAGILGVALLVKAAMWPVGFWLPTTYAAATAPVAAVFAIMTKVGVYAILRLQMLGFGPDWAATGDLGGGLLLAGGLLTIGFGTIGVLASQTLGRLAGYSVLVSSGTLLAVAGTGNGQAIGGALFYLVSSTLALGAFFLVIELVERGRAPGADVLAVTREAFGEEEEPDDEEEEIGIVIPASFALLGIAFLSCALLLAGLPPLSGFIAKFAILNALLGPPAPGGAASISPAAWAVFVLLIVSGLAALIATARAGIRTLWAESERDLPDVRLLEALSVAFLLVLCFGLTVWAGPAMRYMEDTASFLGTPQAYVQGVLSAPGPDAAGGAP